MKNKLIIDFGATRVKSIAKKSKSLFFFETIGSIKFENSKFSPLFFYSSLLKHLNYFKKKKIKINQILVSSEMHGFFLIDEKKNYTPYFSWRFDSKKKNHPIKINFLKKNLFKKTGLIFRAGIPIINYFRENFVSKNFKFLGGVAEAICFFGGEYNKKLSISYAHSTGFYDLNGNFFLKKFFKNSISKDQKTYIGFINFNKKKIKVYCGIGDLQASVLGSELKNNDILINMGTGSQIITRNQLLCKKNVEIRPLHKNITLYCITHIPSGKAISFFCNQISLHKNKSSKYFWNTLSLIKLEDLTNVEGDVNFVQLFKGKGLGKIFFKKNYKYLCCKLIKSYLNQYLIILKNNFKLKKMRSIILSGGIPKKIPVIKEYLNQKSLLKIYVKKDKIDETLLGLKSII